MCPPGINIPVPETGGVTSGHSHTGTSWPLAVWAGEECAGGVDGSGGGAGGVWSGGRDLAEACQRVSTMGSLGSTGGRLAAGG